MSISLDKVNTRMLKHINSYICYMFSGKVDHARKKYLCISIHSLSLHHWIIWPLNNFSGSRIGASENTCVLFKNYRHSEMFFCICVYEKNIYLGRVMSLMDANIFLSNRFIPAAYNCFCCCCCSIAFVCSPLWRVYTWQMHSWSSNKPS